MTRSSNPAVTALLSHFPRPPTHIPVQEKSKDLSEPPPKSAKRREPPVASPNGGDDETRISLDRLDKELPQLPYITPLSLEFPDFAADSLPEIAVHDEDDDEEGDGLVEDEIIEGRPHRIPRLLQRLRHQLMSLDGLTTPNIFRESAPDVEVEINLYQLDHREELTTTDALVPATCIKHYLRTLPNVLVSDITLPVDMTEESCWRIITNDFPTDKRDLLLWCLDLISAVLRASGQETNNAAVLSLVRTFAPNLYSLPPTSPTPDLMRLTLQFIKFVELALKENLKDLGMTRC
ncbi:hypothetical protein SpCBS45565_g06489 [Spizellomyces sp. 'palustris']|nr:hypothetical protein SpCBS45565_g06489 [Spizellomyces sp. 'palustris']